MPPTTTSYIYKIISIDSSVTSNLYEQLNEQLNCLLKLWHKLPDRSTKLAYRNEMLIQLIKETSMENSFEDFFQLYRQRCADQNKSLIDKEEISNIEKDNGQLIS